MGLLNDVRGAREAAKAKKREEIQKNIVYAIKKGIYEFYYGFSSEEEFQELEEIINEMNEELAEDGFVLMFKEKYNYKHQAYQVYIEGQFAYLADRIVKIAIDKQ